METIVLSIALLAIIAIIGALFQSSAIPISLILVVVGMGLSFFPVFPHISLHPDIVLNIFLPLLLYEASAYSSSWKEIKEHLRPIALLSIGHVIFITFLVAAAIRYMIPEINWPLAIAIGAIISPPDDVAIMAIAEKVRIPSRILSVLKGEALLNDATAIIIYRFALIAFLTNQFSLAASIFDFFVIIICQTAYGFVLALLLGNLRIRIKDPSLQMTVSILTPFLAYIPASYLMGSGVIATVATGLFIGNMFWDRYPPDVRLAARTVWTTLGFGVQSILFLLVGLDFKTVVERNAGIHYDQLFLYSLIVVLVVIVGRFIWCFPSAYIPRWLFPSIRKREPKLPWQYPFVVAWAGMRGGISLALALAVPLLPIVGGLNPRDLLVFFVFSVIIATLLIQGLSLPYILKLIGVCDYSMNEVYEEQRIELTTRAAMVAAVLKWLTEYQMQVKDDPLLQEEIKLRLQEYALVEQRLNDRLSKHEADTSYADTPAIKEKTFLLSQMIRIEREELLNFWRDNKLSLPVRAKLEYELDLREKHVEDMI